MTPDQRRFVLHATAFAFRKAVPDDLNEKPRIEVLRHILARKGDGGWPDDLGNFVSAARGLIDAFDARDDARLTRAHLVLRDAAQLYLQRAANADAARGPGR